MGAPPSEVPDWRDPTAYAVLRGAERPIFAWEWLRRDPDYVQAVASLAAEVDFAKAARRPEAQRLAGRFGLHAFEAPDLRAPHARPVWQSSISPDILAVQATDAGPSEDRFDLARAEHLATLVIGPAGSEHLLLCDGLRSIRLDIKAGSVVGRPVRLTYLLAGIWSADPPLLVLRRFLALCRTGGFSKVLHQPTSRSARAILLLRAHDALAAGATQRDIAQTLLSPDASGPRWRITASELRSNAQRLATQARRMAAGGYHLLLDARRCAREKGAVPDARN